MPGRRAASLSWDMPLRLFWLMVLLGLTAVRVDAQRLPIRDYSIQDGLSQSVVTAIFQTADGYLWVGTEVGLNSFNGKEFRVYTRNEGLGSADISALLQLADGTLLVGSNAGIDQLNRQGRFEVHRPTFGRFKSRVTDLLETSDGALWVATEFEGVFRFHNDSFIQYTSRDGLAHNTVHQLVEAPDGAVWAATEGGATAMRGGRFDGLTTADGLPHDRVRDIRFRQDGSQWFATYGGLFIREEGVDRVVRMADGLAADRTTALVEDGFGGMWVATEGGLSYYDGTHFHSYTEDQGLGNRMVTTALRDTEGNLWFGTYGGGLNLLPGYTFIHYTVEEGLRSNMITSVARHDESIWVGTYGGGLTRIRDHDIEAVGVPQGLKDPRVYTLMTDRNGNLWIGTRSGVHLMVDGHIQPGSPVDRLPDPVVRTILEDRIGDIWIGTYGGGIGRYRNGRLVQVYDTTNGLTNNTVMRLTQSEDGSIWAATYGGVSRIGPSGIETYTMDQGLVQNSAITIFEDSRGWIWIGTFAGITVIRGEEVVTMDAESGFPNPVCYFLTEDQYGYVWAGTNRGLVRIDPYITEDLRDPRRIKDQLRFKLYTTESGLPADEMNANAVFRAPDGSLWMGTVAGVAHFRPWLDQAVERGPPIHIEHIYVFDGERPVRSGISFSHDQNFIAFRFTGIQFGHSSQVEYEYRIRDVDQAWQRTRTGEARYTTLPDGDYVFEVRARNNDGFWSQRAATLRFTIRPPFWKAWWFLLLATGALFAMGAFAYNYWTIRKQVDLERIRIKIASDLHDDVGASLTEIALRADFVTALKEPDQVRDSVRQIGQMSRQIVTTMDDIVWSIDARNDTMGDLLDRMQDYAANVLGHQGIEPHFHFEGLDTARSLPLETRQNLYLILKEAVNNAAKHSRARNMHISLVNKDRRFTMSIRDDGRGFPESTRAGSHGLRNMRMRAERIGATLTFESSDQGLAIIVTSPALT